MIDSVARQFLHGPCEDKIRVHNDFESVFDFFLSMYPEKIFDGSPNQSLL